MPAIVVSLADKKKPLTTFQQYLAEQKLLTELDRIIYADEFDDESTHEEIVGPMPNLNEFEIQQKKGKTLKEKNMPTEIAVLYNNPVMSKIQEQHQFRKYNFFKYKAKRLFNKLSFTAEQTIIRHLNEAIKLKKFIADCNVRLAMSAAKKQVFLSKKPDKIWDFLGEANWGIMRSIPCFDFTIGDKFSTYAMWAIKNNFFRLYRIECIHQQHFVNGIDQKMFDGPQDEDMIVEELDFQQCAKDTVEELLKDLDPRESDIIRLYLLNKEKGKTLESIGLYLGISKERVRQIKKRGLKTLENNANKQALFNGFLKEFVSDKF